MRSRYRYLVLVAVLSGPSGLSAQDTLKLLPIPLERVEDSATARLPASHRTVAKAADEPVKVHFWPLPIYPAAPGEYLPARVELLFVVDTFGRPEVQDMVVLEASHSAFIAAARRAIGKCRYEPARLRGRPVRVRVQQAVAFRLSPEDEQ